MERLEVSFIAVEFEHYTNAYMTNAKKTNFYEYFIFINIGQNNRTSNARIKFAMNKKCTSQTSSYTISWQVPISWHVLSHLLTSSFNLGIIAKKIAIMPNLELIARGKHHLTSFIWTTISSTIYRIHRYVALFSTNKKILISPRWNDSFRISLYWLG